MTAAGHSFRSGAACVRGYGRGRSSRPGRTWHCSCKVWPCICRKRGCTACARQPTSGRGGATRFLMTYFPRPPGGGPALLPYARRPRREHVPRVARVEEQRPWRHGEGRGLVGPRCAQHGSPSCRRCLQMGWGISRCCRAGHEGHMAPGQAPPPQPRAPGRQVLAPVARQAGASALSAWLGRARPASAALPAPERPSQRARRLEPRRLARQAPSPDRDVVPASRRARRASPPRPAATGEPPPPPLPHKGRPLWGCRMFSAASRLPC